MRQFLILQILMLTFCIHSSSQIDSALFYSHVDTNKSLHFLEQIYGNKDKIPDFVLKNIQINYHFSRENYDIAESICLQIIESGENETYILGAKVQLMKIYTKQGKIEESTELSKEVILGAKYTANQKVIALNNIANILLDKNNTTEALQYLKQATIIASENYCPEAAVTQLLLSFAYVSEGIYTRVEETLKKGLQISKHLHNPSIELKLINNLGVFYFVDEKYDSARFYFTKLSNEAQRYSFNEQQIIALFNLSNVAYNQGNLELARFYLDEVYKQWDIVNPRLRARVMFTYGVLFYDNAEYVKAEYYLTESVKLGIDQQNSNILLLAYEILAKNYAALGKHKYAYETQKAYSILSDSINDADRMLAFDIFESEIDLLEKNNRIIQQTLDLNKLREDNENFKTLTIRVITISIIIIILIVNISIIYILRKRYALKKQFSKDVISENEKFRFRIASELHDDIGQQLSLIMHRENISSDSELKSSITHALESLRNLTKLIYPQALNIMGLIPLLRKVLNEIEDKNKISTLLSADEHCEKLMSNEMKINTFRIIQECISNSVKHSNASSINVRIHLKDKIINVYYNDNGHHDVGKKLNAGFGLSSMNLRSEIIDANISYQLKPQGFKMKLSIPLKIIPQTQELKR